MHLHHPVRRRTTCAYTAAMRRYPSFGTTLLGSTLATAKAADMVTPTPILPYVGRPPDLLATNGDTPLA